VLELRLSARKEHPPKAAPRLGRLAACDAAADLAGKTRLLLKALRPAASRRLAASQHRLPPLDVEAIAYRWRLLRRYQPHSKEFAKINLSKIKDDALFEGISARIMDAACLT